MILNNGMSPDAEISKTKVVCNQPSTSLLPDREVVARTCFAQRTVSITPDADMSLQNSSSASDNSDIPVSINFEMHKAEKISQRHLFKANNQQLFDREKGLFADIAKQVDCYKKIKEELDQLAAEVECQGKMKFERMIAILGNIYERSHLERIREDVLEAKNGRYMDEVSRMLNAWANYHLDQLSVLLMSFANDSHSFPYGIISESPLVIEVVQELSLELGPADLANEILSEVSRYKRGARRHRRNFQNLLSSMQLMDMFSPVVQYETQQVELVAASANQGEEAIFLNAASTTGGDYAQTGMRILWNKNFVSAKNFAKRYSELFVRKEGIGGFMITKRLAQVFDDFCQHHAIAKLIHICAGIGTLQAAMNSIGSNVAVTSLDTYSGEDILKPQDGQRQMVFFDEFDEEGVVIEEYGKYLSAHRELISSDSCLLITFPDVQGNSSCQVKKALQCWGLLGGGLVIVLSEVKDKNLIYSNLFANGGLLKRDSNAVLPPEFLRIIPHVSPELFTIERSL